MFMFIYTVSLYSNYWQTDLLHWTNVANVVHSLYADIFLMIDTKPNSKFTYKPTTRLTMAMAVP